MTGLHAIGKTNASHYIVLADRIPAGVGHCPILTVDQSAFRIENQNSFEIALPICLGHFCLPEIGLQTNRVFDNPSSYRGVSAGHGSAFS